jgi:isopenicillin N synthase-like dioxygenase
MTRASSHEWVPEIDVSPLRALDIDALGGGPPSPDALAAAEPAAAAIDAACREVGFFTVVGHGVDPARFASLDRAARSFFALPDETKAEIAMARGGRAWRGWFPLGGELTSGVPDRKEGIYFGEELPADDERVVAGRPLHGPNLFPARPAELRLAVLDHLDAMTRLGQAILAGMAIGLGLDARWFVDHLTADPVILFRIFHYPPDPAVAGTDPREHQDRAGWGVAEHTDYGLLTLLGQDGTPGLEVRAPGGWTAVDARSDRFVCNIGDMLERLTGGRYRSTPHRVRNTSAVERRSFPFFLDPSWDAVVERLPITDGPSTDDAPAATSRWDGASVHDVGGTYGDYLLAKVTKVFPALADAAGPPNLPPA